MGDDCDLPGFVLSGCVRVVCVWRVGVFVAIQSVVPAVSRGTPGSGGAPYGLDLRVILYVHMRAP